MQMILYKCDNPKCRRILKSPHISIRLRSHSGWVAKEEDDEWKHQGTLDGYVQFCNTICMAAAFDALEKVPEDFG